MCEGAFDRGARSNARAPLPPLSSPIHHDSPTPPMIKDQVMMGSWRVWACVCGVRKRGARAPAQGPLCSLSLLFISYPVHPVAQPARHGVWGVESEEGARVRGGGPKTGVRPHLFRQRLFHTSVRRNARPPFSARGAESRLAPPHAPDPPSPHTPLQWPPKPSTSRRKPRTPPKTKRAPR